MQESELFETSENLQSGKKPNQPRNLLPSKAPKTNCEPTHIAEAKAPVKHLKTKKATCDICSKILSRSNLKQHIKEVHRTTPAYKDLQITCHQVRAYSRSVVICMAR